MTPQEPAMGVSDEAVRAAWMAFTGRDLLGPAYADDADHMAEDECRDMRAALLAALPHMQPAGATQPAPVDWRRLRDHLIDLRCYYVEALEGVKGYEQRERQFTDLIAEVDADIALLSAQPSADAGDADEERLLGPREEHFGRAYIDAACADGVWTHPDHVFEFIEKRARELHEAAIAAQREAGSA